MEPSQNETVKQKCLQISKSHAKKKWQDLLKFLGSAKAASLGAYHCYQL